MFQSMNLKPHVIGLHNPITVSGPGDIEGHMSQDGQFYLLDFARVFPPEDPSP